METNSKVTEFTLKSLFFFWQFHWSIQMSPKSSLIFLPLAFCYSFDGKKKSSVGMWGGNVGRFTREIGCAGQTYIHWSFLQQWNKNNKANVQTISFSEDQFCWNVGRECRATYESSRLGRTISINLFPNCKNTTVNYFFYSLFLCLETSTFHIGNIACLQNSRNYW